jgi:hypothetical protein
MSVNVRDFEKIESFCALRKLSEVVYLWNLWLSIDVCENGGYGD